MSDRLEMEASWRGCSNSKVHKIRGLLCALTLGASCVLKTQEYVMEIKELHTQLTYIQPMRLL
jgi:hypothetical protein